MNRTVKILSSFGLIIWCAACKHGDPPANPANAPVPVNTFKVTRKPVVYYDSYPATTVALKEVRLFGQVTGYITGIYFQEGQRVRKGEKLYEIDRSKYIASYNQAKDNVEIAKANLERATRDANRYAELNKQEAIAKQLYENAMTDLKNMQLQVTSAQAELAKNQSDLSYSIITAPFDGTIGISSVRLGTLVIPGQTLLNTVSSDDPIGVDFVINEGELSRFQQFEQNKIPKNDSTFRILLSNEKIFKANGQLSIIDRAIDPQTGTLRVRLMFPNPNSILKAGLSCNAQVLNENSGSQIIIPYRAVVEQMGEYFVYVVNGKIANQVKIALGAKLGPNVIVHDGIAEGKEIVTDGVQKLHNGSLIQTEGTKSAG
jgi:membrane fusion protein (multidrug efflux system)